MRDSLSLSSQTKPLFMNRKFTHRSVAFYFYIFRAFDYGSHLIRLCIVLYELTWRDQREKEKVGIRLVHFCNNLSQRHCFLPSLYNNNNDDNNNKNKNFKKKKKKKLCSCWFCISIQAQFHKFVFSRLNFRIITK